MKYVVIEYLIFSFHWRIKEGYIYNTSNVIKCYLLPNVIVLVILVTNQGNASALVRCIES